MPAPCLALCNDLNALVPEILAQWQGITREEPWLTLPEEHRFDALPDLVHDLLDAAVCQPNDPAAHRAMLEAAATHGESRQAQGFPQELVLTEAYLLREAIWRVLQRHAPAEATAAVLRVDTLVALSTRASLFGYHRLELEAMGRWPGQLDRLAAESPLARGA